MLRKIRWTDIALIALPLALMTASSSPTYAHGGHGGHSSAGSGGHHSHRASSERFEADGPRRAESGESAAERRIVDPAAPRMPRGGHRPHYSDGTEPSVIAPLSISPVHYSHVPSSTAWASKYAPARYHRSFEEKKLFWIATGHPHGWPGHIVDHVVPLACGGADAPSNMQWQTIADAKAKDKVERIGCHGGHR